MVISPTASWIRWCMQGYAWWFNVDLSCLGRTIYAIQFLGAKPLIQFRHRWAEREHSDHLYCSEPPSRMPNSLMPSVKLRSANLPFFYVFGVTWSGIEPRPLAPWADTLTTMLRGDGVPLMGQFRQLQKIHRKIKMPEQTVLDIFICSISQPTVIYQETDIDI